MTRFVLFFWLISKLFHISKDIMSIKGYIKGSYIKGYHEYLEYWEILRTLILKNTCERLLLYYVSYFGKNDENKLICVYIRNTVRNHIPWWKMIWWWQIRNLFTKIYFSKVSAFFYVVRTFRVVSVVKQGTIGGIFVKKIRKSIDSKDQIRLCFHKKGKNYQKFCCCLCSSKAFSIHVKISFAHPIASLWPASSKPLIMESFWCLRWLYISTIHRAWRGFKSLNLRDTLTSPGITLFDSCLLTLSGYQLLNLFEINFFAD